MDIVGYNQCLGDLGCLFLSSIGDLAKGVGGQQPLHLHPAEMSSSKPAQRQRELMTSEGTCMVVTSGETWDGSVPFLAFLADALVPGGSIPDPVSPPSAEPMPPCPVDG